MNRKRLIFVTGAEGSGTTLLRRLLAAAPTSASIGQDFETLPPGHDARLMFAAFNEAHHRLWDRDATLEAQQAARVDFHSRFQDMMAAPAFNPTTHFIYKRSSPFGSPHGRRRPDLWDVVDLQEDARLVIIYRDPRAATYSAFRRGFDSNLARLARVCEDHLTSLAAQAAALGPEKLRVVSYRALCQAPGAVLQTLAEFCDLDPGPICEAALAEGLKRDSDTRFRRELENSAIRWLDGHFDRRRCSQWGILSRDDG